MFALINIAASVSFDFVYMQSPNGRPTSTQIHILATLSILSLLLIPYSSVLSFCIGAGALLMNFTVFGVICLATTIPVLFGDSGFPVQCSHRFRVGDSELKLVFPWYECTFDHVTVNPKFVQRFHQLQKQEHKIAIERIIFSCLQEYFYFKSVQSFYVAKRNMNQ
jgi:hypothetical protein